MEHKCEISLIKGNNCCLIDSVKQNKKQTNKQTTTTAKTNNNNNKNTFSVGLHLDIYKLLSLKPFAMVDIIVTGAAIDGEVNPDHHNTSQHSTSQYNTSQCSTKHPRNTLTTIIPIHQHTNIGHLHERLHFLTIN